MTPRAERCTFHTLAGAFAARTRNTPGPTAWLVQVLLGDQVLALPGLAVDHRDAVRVRPGLDPAGEPARHPHQVRVVQLLVAVAVQPPPPAPEPARVMPQREIGVQHDPVHAVIASRSAGPRTAR